MRVIRGGGENPRPDDAEVMFFCPRCNGHAVITLQLGPTRKKRKGRWRKHTGGTSIKVCARCYQADGDMTPIS